MLRALPNLLPVNMRQVPPSERPFVPWKQERGRSRRAGLGWAAAELPCLQGKQEVVQGTAVKSLEM